MRLWNKLALAPFPLPFRPFAFAAGRWPGLLPGLALGLAAQGARAGDAEPAEGEPSEIADAELLQVGDQPDPVSRALVAGELVRVEEDGFAAPLVFWKSRHTKEEPT